MFRLMLAIKTSAIFPSNKSSTPKSASIFVQLLRSKFSMAFSYAHSSMSMAQTFFAPNFSAAIAKTAVPLPMSMTSLSFKSSSNIFWRTKYVVAWCPVPKLIFGSMIKSRTPSFASWNGALTRQRLSTSMGSNCDSHSAFQLMSSISFFEKWMVTSSMVNSNNAFCNSSVSNCVGT